MTARHALAASLAAASLLLASPLAAADKACRELYAVFYEPDQAEDQAAFHSLTDELPITLGATGKIFLAYREGNGTRHVLNVRFERPRATADQRLLHVAGQDAKDIEMGRVDVEAVGTGRVRLPYTITGARGGADVFAEVPERCRSGHLTVRIVAAPARPAPAPTPAPAERAARELATRLSSAVLGGSPADARVLETYTATLLRDGRDGLVAVTADLLASAAFQQRLPESARKVRVVPDSEARVDDLDRRELLFGLYDALLGSGQVTISEHRANTGDLGACLASYGDPAAACRQLAARLVGHPAFVSRYGSLLAEAGIPYVQPADPTPGVPALAERYRAARDLVELLFTGLLRRDDGSAVHEDYVDQVAEEGWEGLLAVAGEVAASVEFRVDAPQRAVAAHPELEVSPRDRGAVVKSALLGDIYGSLYRLAGVSLDERRRHQELLDRCLDRSDLDVCRELGRALVGHPLFRESHASALRLLAPATIGR